MSKVNRIVDQLGHEECKELLGLVGDQYNWYDTRLLRDMCRATVNMLIYHHGSFDRKNILDRFNKLVIKYTT